MCFYGSSRTLNCGTPGADKESGKLILISCPLKIHVWDDGSLLDMLARKTASGGWELADPRSTPKGFFNQLRERLPELAAISHTQHPPDWPPPKLQVAAEVWVTKDLSR